MEQSSTLIVGGASGLGAASAKCLHNAGAYVLIADLDEERGQGIVSQLGSRATFMQTDVTQPEQVQRAVHAAAQQGDGLRLSVCCAGIGWAEKTVGRQGPHQLEPFQQLVNVNLMGTFNVLRLSAAAMISNTPNEDGERGLCINTASIAAYEGQIGQLAYAATKGGIVSMTVPAARDLADNGVRVCTIAPGLFDTPLLAKLPQAMREALAASIPFPRRFGKPEEYAELVLHIANNPMLNGEVIRLDGALRMAPR